MALTISEDWIRRRVKLKHDNLDDVRSLSLPGTYHEKIGGLGDSLHPFTRLKALDLSRNALDSIAGIQNARLLEKLNLYYNNISSLQDLHRLRENPRLQELDLRLNPVARNEPDYRLFLIHMLPNLRRLDDRSVRDGERKAALMHFTSEQAAELTNHPQPAQPTQPSREKNPRVELVRSLAKPNPVSAFDDDDVAVLDLVSRQGNDFNQPKPITGSQQKTPQVQDYSSYDRRKMNLAGEGLEYPLPQEMVSSQPAYQIPNRDADPLLAKYPNLVPAIVTTPPSEHTQQQTQKSIQGEDLDLYTSYKADGHFTPHPNQENKTFNKTEEIEKEREKVNKNYVEEFREDVSAHGVEFYDPRELAEEVFVAPTPKKVEAPPTTSQNEIIDSGEFSSFIHAISSMVDKYWNGNQSLLKNQRFNSQMCSLLSEVRSATVMPLSKNPSSEREFHRLQDELRCAREENSQLREKLLISAEIPEAFENMDEGKSKSALIRAQRDVGILKGRLQRSLDENKGLQENLMQLENRNKELINSGQCMGSDELKQENSRLKHELKTLEIRLRQASQMQEFAVMLQESHKSLVQTNEHLLRDLDDARRRIHENPRNGAAYKQTFNGS